MFHLLTSLYTDLTQRPRFNVLFVGSADSGKTTLLQVIKSHYVENNPLPSRSTESSAASANGRHPGPGQITVLPKTRSTVGQNVLDLPAPAPSSRPLVKPSHPQPSLLPSSEAASAPSAWFSTGLSRAPSSSKRPASKALIHIWDLGGDVALRNIWEKYYAETDAVVYFWDCERGGNGEGREKEWDTVAKLAQDPRLASTPFLVLLSRCDLIASPLSHSRRPSQAAVTVDSTAEDKGLPTTSDSAEEDTDFDASIEHASQQGPLGANLVRSSSQQQAAKVPIGIPIDDLKALPPDALRDRDLVESLRVFIQSNIEAATRRIGASDPIPPVSGYNQDRSAAAAAGEDVNDGQPPQLANETEVAATFPETTIFPLSVLTGRGVEECMDWIVHKSLAAGRSTREGEEAGA